MAVDEVHPTGAEDEIDVLNWWFVGARGDEIVIANPPTLPMSRDKALVLAAWIVTLADPLGGRFGEILKAVQST